MSYVLILMFEYHRYQSDAVIRVYADNHLVDEINLTEDIKLKCKNRDSTPIDSSMRQGPKNLSHVCFMPEKLFMFEINEKHLNDRIRIEIKNNNNNYTNGFMNKFSYVNFHYVMLMPKCLLELRNWMPLKRFMSAVSPVSKVKYYPRRGLMYEDIIFESNTNPWEGDFLFHRRGGSFSVDVPLYKKHGLVHLAKPVPGKISINYDAARILWWFKQLNTTT